MKASIFPIFFISVFLVFLALLAWSYRKSSNASSGFFDVKVGALWGIAIGWLIMTVQYLFSFFAEPEVSNQLNLHVGVWLVGLIAATVVHRVFFKYPRISAVKTVCISAIVAPIAWFCFFEVLGPALRSLALTLR